MSLSYDEQEVRVLAAVSQRLDTLATENLLTCPTNDDLRLMALQREYKDFEFTPFEATGLEEDEEEEADEVVYCDYCGEPIPADELGNHMQRDGSQICEHCYEESFFTCEECGFVHHWDGVVNIEDNFYCGACASDNFFECEDCGSWHSREHVTDIGGTDRYRWICDDCIENYICCSECGEWARADDSYYSDATGDTYCCYECARRADPSEERINEYGYKPVPDYLKVDADVEHAVYFGVELEYNFDDADSRNAVLDEFENMGDAFYFKRDGSLDTYGVECVSHPGTLLFWNSQREELDNIMKAVGWKAFIEDGTGMHIHISKGGMSAAHMQRFDWFFIENREKFIEYAHREADHWAPIPTEKSDEVPMIHPNTSRYRGVNWQNRNTVEIRIFLSPNNTEYLLSSIQLCHAVYAFTKTCLNGSWNNFRRFVAMHGEKYPDLKKVMRDRGDTYVQPQLVRQFVEPEFKLTIPEDWEPQEWRIQETYRVVEA